MILNFFCTILHDQRHTVCYFLIDDKDYKNHDDDDDGADADNCGPVILEIYVDNVDGSNDDDMSQLLLLGKFEYGGGPIFKVVLEC